MSGVEVAGLVLGVLPLFISALEDYNDGLDPIKAFMRWERELPNFIRKLRNQHVHYAQTTRLLLEPITTEFELAEMLAEPNGQIWKDEAMARKLKDKLQESYQAYQNTITDIEGISKKIANKLDIDREANTLNELEALLAANPQKANSRFEFRRRVRFGMSKKTIKGLLEELDECNKELERFLDRSEKLETVRKTSKPSFASRLQRIQGFAKNLHQVLASSWTCTCRSCHKTSLQLDQRANLFTSGLKMAQAQPKGTFFMVSFSSTADPWQWQEAEIRVEEDNNVESEPPTVKLAVGKPKIAKTVSFSKPPPPYSVLPAAEHIAKPTLEEVTDLCASIQHLHKSTSCIGLSLDGQSKLRGVFPVDAPGKPATPGETVSLSDILNHPPVVNGRLMKLSKKERYSLAVTLASSTLQLNSTPWFPDQWSKKDILFHKIVTGPRLIDIEHPYITSETLELSKTVSNGPRKMRGFYNKNTTLLALGIALLELYFGTSAEKYREADQSSDNGPFNPWTLCAMAYEWAEEAKEDLSAAFLSAVTHCLRCFSDPGASLQDPEFLQAAVEGIVLPLQDELCQFLGKTPP